MASKNNSLIVRLNGYLVDVTIFADAHPGGRQKIINLFRKQAQTGALCGPNSFPDASPDFNSHFGSTVSQMRKSFIEYERKFGGEGSMEVKFSGFDTKSQPYGGSVFIVGKAPR